MNGQDVLRAWSGSPSPQRRRESGRPPGCGNSHPTDSGRCGLLDPRGELEVNDRADNQTQSDQDPQGDHQEPIGLLPPPEPRSCKVSASLLSAAVPDLLIAGITYSKSAMVIIASSADAASVGAELPAVAAADPGAATSLTVVLGSDVLDPASDPQAVVPVRIAAVIRAVIPRRTFIAILFEIDEVLSTGRVCCHASL